MKTIEVKRLRASRNAEINEKQEPVNCCNRVGPLHLTLFHKNVKNSYHNVRPISWHFFFLLLIR